MKKTKKVFGIFLALISISIIFLGVYKIFFNNTSGDEKIYTNFKITKVSAKNSSNKKINNDSTFIIETDKKVNKESVRRSVYVEPAIEYEIKKINSTKYELVPAEELVDNQVYVVQNIKNETAVYKWAFQTERKLSVSYFSLSNSYNVENDSAMQLMFSVEDVEDINKYVTISPSISGTWKKYNSVWVFETKEKFKSGAEYTIKVSKGIKAGNYTMEEDFVDTFEIDDIDSESNIYSVSVTLDDVNTFTTKERPQAALRYNMGTDEVTATVFKFSDISTFKAAIISKKVDKTKLEKIIEEKSQINNGVVTLAKTLSTGYYVIEYSVLGYKNQLYKVDQLVQVNDNQTYVINTEKDVLVWTIKDGNIKSGVSVELNGKTIKSNDEGIAKFSNVSDKTGTKTFVTVDSASKNPLIVQVNNYKNDSYPNAYIYTDRPIYKPTDSINVWGYIPIEEWDNDIKDKFTIRYGNTKKKVKIGKDGTFNLTIDLDNNIDNQYFSIELYYGEDYLANRNVEIYDYVKPTYTYQIDIDKKYYYAGDTISFDVNVEHITGLKVNNKTVKVIFDDKKYTAKTNSNGVAHFDIKTSYDKNNNSEYSYREIGVTTGDSEDDYENIQATKEVIIYNYNVTLDGNIVKEGNNLNLEIKSRKIDFAKLNKEEDYLPEESGAGYNSNVLVKIYKYTSKRYIADSYYDDYEGKIVYEYGWEDNNELVDEFSVALKDGKGIRKNIKYEDSTYTDDFTLYYSVNIEIEDTNGRKYKTSAWRHYDSDSLKFGYYFDHTPYYSYRIKSDKESAKNNQEFNLQLYDFNGRKVENKGKVLTVFFDDEIVENKVFDTNKMSTKFSKEMFPGTYIAGAYLIDGKVYRLRSDYVDFDETEKESKIEIVTDKEKYGPGDEVTLKINVKDINGKGLKSNVSISVVDESIFEIQEDYINILNDIYMNRYFKMYQMSTSRDYSIQDGGGMGSASGGRERYNFKDTAYYKVANTNNKGEIEVTFKLPDNITKYRITVHAGNKEGYVGSNTKNIVATQDFFVESVKPINVKYNDDLVINAISHGDNVSGEVSYTFEIGNKKITSKSKIDEYTSVNFGNFDIGEYEVKITAKSKDYTDVLKYKVNIVGNTQEVPVKTTQALTDKLDIKPTKNPIVLEIYDKQLEKYLKYLDKLSSVYSSRIDTKISVYESMRLRNKYSDSYSYEGIVDLSYYDYSVEGLLSKYENDKNPDVLLSAVVNMFAKQYFLNATIDDFESILLNKEANSKDIYSAYLGLAASLKTSFENLDALNNDSKRSDLENIILYTSYAVLGDYDTATKLYETLKAEVKDGKVLINNNEVTNDDVSGMLAILTSMVDKNTSSKIIDLLIDKNSTSMYTNFAIIAYINNTTGEIEEEKKVTIKYGNEEKTISINGFKIYKLDLNNKELKNVKFSNTSKDLIVSYYYTTGIDEINSDKIIKDVKISMKNQIKKNQDVNLNIKYTNKTDDGYTIKIAIPNGLSLNKENLKLGDYVYLDTSMNSYAILYVSNKVTNLDLNVVFSAINEGKYVFEPIVIESGNKYHISNKVNIKIDK